MIIKKFKLDSFIIIITCISFASCAAFINNIDDDLLTQKSIPYKKKISKQTYCSEESSTTLISEDSKSQKIFNQFTSKYKFTYADKLVLWTFVQMNLRPDLTTPSSKLQLFTEYNGRENYYHFFTKSKSDAYPLLYGLEYILKQYRSNYSLTQLAKIFDSNYPNQFFVNSEFSKFLEVNFNKIKDDKSLARFYSRADEPLREGERIYKQKLLGFVNKYYASKKKIKYIKSDYLFEFKKNNLIQTKCNYDMELYNNSIYLINDKFINSHMFGLRQDKNVFLAASSQSLSNFNSISNSIYFKGEYSTEAAAMCSFKSKVDKNKNIWLVSSNSRDPGQHLFHLIEYGLNEINDIKELDSLLKFSRHLFLKKPVRLILESERSSEAQLDQLLKLNMPIYNSEKLGKVWGYLDLKNKHNFIIDDRRLGELSCNIKK